MGKVTSSGGASIAALLCLAASAHATGFATTESGVWNQTTMGGMTDTLDAMTVTGISSNPPGLTFDTALLLLAGPGGGGVASGDLTLYGGTVNDFLEFQVADGADTLGTNGESLMSANATLVASGGAFAQYTSGSGRLIAELFTTGSAGGMMTGVSSSAFAGNLNPAPEPLSFAALGMGVVGLCARRRR